MDKKTYKPPRGVDDRTARQTIFPFNENSSKKSPTNMSDSFKHQKKETFGITKKWQNEGPH